jgi:5-(carboxyamino)imidazole ribonucleotide mutase
MGQVIIIMGSKADSDHCLKIKQVLDLFKVPCILRIASAHKVPLKVLEILRQYKDGNIVYITVAGRSNALSGFIDANTVHPVIACPPYSDSFSGADVFSSLRMPSGVCPLVVLDPAQAALAAVKILSLADGSLRDAVARYQNKLRQDIDDDDNAVRNDIH